MRTFLAAFLIIAAAPAWAADGFGIAKIRAHLFHEYTGGLSEDILVSEPVLWNTVIGEGGAAEPASNVLVVIEMSVPGGEASSELPLVVEVLSDNDGWKRVTRKSFDFIYATPGQPGIARGVWVEHVTCSPMRIIATHGPDRREAEVPFHCGE